MERTRTRIRRVLIVICLLTIQTAFAELSDSVIRPMFYPYAAGKPSVPGLTPGTTISKDSWEAARDYLPTEILDKIKAGEFSFTII